MKHPPKSLQGFLWSTNVNLLDIDRDRSYIIHQIFTFGRLQEFKWLFKTYSLDELKKTFLNQPSKEYQRARYYFIKDRVLGLKAYQPDEHYYVRNLPRIIGQKPPQYL